MTARESPRDSLPIFLLAATTLAFFVLPGTWTLALAEPLFSDVSKAAGVEFVHFNGMTGDFHFPEMTGQGGAFLDFDRDGDLDIYLVQGAMLESGKKPNEAIFPFDGENPPKDRLLRNDLIRDGKKSTQVRFVDITEASGIESLGYGMGVATGDYDGDGWTDLYLTNYGPNQLFRNRGNGTFEDVTTKAGANDPRWSTSASFLDYDQDGKLDLFVANYVDYKVADKIQCYANSSRRDYCGPSGFKPVPDRLLRNRGDGTFEDVSLATGIGRSAGAGLGVVAADFNSDGFLDIFVTNDGQENHLWLGQKKGTFTDDALFAGVALNRQGKAEASMGVDVADFDGDGDLDLFMTHLTGETNTLYANDGSGLFEDRTVTTQLASGSLPYTAFGTAWLDYDNDGWLDLVALNGAVRIQDALARKGDLYPLDQPNQLFHNRGGKSFEEVPAAVAGTAFGLSEVSRGAAVGDVDNDGDKDLLILNNSGPARLLLNEAGHGAPWLGLSLIHQTGGDALGATVRIVRKGRAAGKTKPDIFRHVHTDGSYCSANDPRILVGLGAPAPATVDEIHVTWPGGEKEVFQKIPVGRYTELRQGKGKQTPETSKEASS